MFVHEQKCLCRNHDLISFLVRAPDCLGRIVREIEPFPITKGMVHGITADPRFSEAADEDGASIRRASEQVRVRTCIWPDGTGGHIDRNVPISSTGTEIQRATHPGRPGRDAYARGS